MEVSLLVLRFVVVGATFDDVLVSSEAHRTSAVLPLFFFKDFCGVLSLIFDFCILVSIVEFCISLLLRFQLLCNVLVDDEMEIITLVVFSPNKSTKFERIGRIRNPVTRLQ